jgi:cell division cycle 14
MTKTLLQAIVMSEKGDTVYIAQNIKRSLDSSYRCFVTTRILEYQPYNEEFGPFNISGIIRFVRILDRKRAELSPHKVVYYVEAGREMLTHAVYLLGAYMVLKYGSTASQVYEAFQWINHDIAAPFQDTDYGFDLNLADCWVALQRSRDLGWLRIPADINDFGPWGKIDPDEYEHYSNPLNADMNEIVPGELMIFSGPKDLGGPEYIDDQNGCRYFSPAYFVEIFQEMGVSTVISLNEPEYDPREFESNGFSHHELDFSGHPMPSEQVSLPRSPPYHARTFARLLTSHRLQVVDRFLKIAARSRGLVAVHSAAGRGRPGALAALHLMRRHGFAARDAIAWLRIVRPGSVSGALPHLLCGLEPPTARPRDKPSLAPSTTPRLLTPRPPSSGTPRDSPRTVPVPVAVLVGRRVSRAAPSPSPGSLIAHSRGGRSAGA